MAKVKHMVLSKFKEGTTEEQITKCFDGLLDVTEGVPGIEDYVSGPNNSPSGMSMGFTHGVVITFTDTAARDAYLAHPEHEKFKSEVMPLVETVAVLDFEV